MRFLLPNASPINPGLEWQDRIEFPPEFWDAEGLGSGTLTANVCMSPSGVVIAQLLSTTGGITREAGNVLRLALSAAQTGKAKVRDTGSVTFNFIRPVPGLVRPVPGLFTWPVSNLV